MTELERMAREIAAKHLGSKQPRVIDMHDACLEMARAVIEKAVKWCGIERRQVEYAMHPPEMEIEPGPINVVYERGEERTANELLAHLRSLDTTKLSDKAEGA